MHSLRGPLDSAYRTLARANGHLKVTEGGDLLFHFPTGFKKPWKTQETLKEWLQRTGQAAWSGENSDPV